MTYGVCYMSLLKKSVFTLHTSNKIAKKKKKIFYISNISDQKSGLPDRQPNYAIKVRVPFDPSNQFRP